MKNKLLLLILGLFLTSALQAQSNGGASILFPKHGFGIQTSIFSTSMYGEDELFVSIAPTITSQRGRSMSYIGLQMTPKPSGIVLGYQRTFMLIGYHKKIGIYYGLDGQVGKITLRVPSTCPQIEFRSRDLMALGSVNLGVETTLPFGESVNWIAHVQGGIADMEVAGPCPANEVNAIFRAGMRVQF